MMDNFQITADEMPESCLSCPFWSIVREDLVGVCFLTGNAINLDGVSMEGRRMDECPIKRKDKAEKEPWILCSERLPNHLEFIESYDPSNYGAEFLVTIAGAEKATTLYYSQTGNWYDEEGNFYKVLAWQKMPDIYRMKTRQEQEDDAQERYVTEWLEKRKKKRER